MQIVIIAVITVFVLLSVLSGVGKGMKWLSSFNLRGRALLVFILSRGTPSTSCGSGCSRSAPTCRTSST
jgi:choline-glycine betaine transporter